MHGQFKPTLVDLFCGAGGLSIGFRRAGFDLVCAVDSWSPAIATYRNNVDRNHVIDAFILPEIDLPSATVVAGGPPCQGFSSAGRRHDDDERNSLVTVFAKIVARLRPKAFVFENVEGFITGANGKFVLDLLEPLIAAGYHVHLRKINAANYGVPQHRKRVIAIGGLGWNPTFPEPTHSALGAPGSRLAGTHLPRTPSVADALVGLPSPCSGSLWPTDHDSRPLEGIDLERAKLLEPGQRMRDLPERLWHDSYRKRAFRRVKDGTPTEKRGGAPAGLRLLDSNEPAKAITGGALRDFLHQTENRPLTIRECARLQTFDDDCVFTGTKAEKIQLIGNAVPPRLAEHFARCLVNDLRSRDELHVEPEGALLSFVPTLSNGMSPALTAVSERVRSRFGLSTEIELQKTLRV